MDNYEIYNIFDEPIPYFKNKEDTTPLLIYPVLMENYIIFNSCTRCLILEKNRTPDIKTISMSYLDYIFYYSDLNKDNEVYLHSLLTLLGICLRSDIQDVLIDKDNRHYLKIQDNIYDKNDFNKIKEIICSQNMVDLPDETIHPSIRKALKEEADFKRRNSGNNEYPPSLEKQIICLMESMHWSKEQIKKITIRTFVQLIQTIDYKIHYKIYKAASMSGMVTFEKEIPHWMSDIKTKETGTRINLDKFKEDIKK